MWFNLIDSILSLKSKKWKSKASSFFFLDQNEFLSFVAIGNWIAKVTRTRSERNGEVKKKKNGVSKHQCPSKNMMWHISKADYFSFSKVQFCSRWLLIITYGLIYEPRLSFFFIWYLTVSIYFTRICRTLCPIAVVSAAAATAAVILKRFTFVWVHPVYNNDLRQNHYVGTPHSVSIGLRFIRRSLFVIRSLSLGW